MIMGEFILGVLAIVLAIGVVGYLLYILDKWHDSLSGKNKNRVALLVFFVLLSLFLFWPAVAVGRYLISLVVH